MNTSLVFGERVGCTIENSWKLVGCVRRGREGKDADAFLGLVQKNRPSHLFGGNETFSHSDEWTQYCRLSFQIRSLFSLLENASHFVEDIVILET